jgi:hypothetical protein
VIAEPVGDPVQREALDEDRAQGLIATMGTLPRLEEEATARAVIHDVGSWC